MQASGFPHDRFYDNKEERDMIQTCISILAGALAGVAVYRIQKCRDKKSQTTQNPLPSFQNEQTENESSCSGPYSAEDVANFIIDYVNVELGSAINNWMLNCILYYVQGIFLANGFECFKEDIWTYTICPVVPCVYESYVYNGSTGIVSFEKRNSPIAKADGKRIEDIVKRMYRINVLNLSDKIQSQAVFEKHYDAEKVDDNNPFYEAIPKDELKVYFAQFVVGTPKNNENNVSDKDCYEVYEICDYVLEYVLKRNRTINVFKLNSLLYIMQASYLHYYNKSLFNENFEAWMAGPTLPSVWKKYKKFGGCSILSRDFQYNIKNEDTIFLNEIIDIFGECSETSLSDMMISQKAYEDAFKLRIPNCSIMPVIENEAIKTSFSGFLAEAQEKT